MQGNGQSCRGGVHKAATRARHQQGVVACWRLAARSDGERHIRRRHVGIGAPVSRCAAGQTAHTERYRRSKAVFRGQRHRVGHTMRLGHSACGGLDTDGEVGMRGYD